MVALEAEKWCSDSSAIFAQIVLRSDSFFVLYRACRIALLHRDRIKGLHTFLGHFCSVCGILHDELFRSRDVRFGGLGNSESCDIELEARLWRLLPHVSGAIKWITHE